MIEIRKLSALAQMGVVDVDNDDLFYVTDTSAGESKSIRKDDLADAINFISSDDANILTNGGNATSLHSHSAGNSPFTISSSNPRLYLNDTSPVANSLISGNSGILSLLADTGDAVADSNINFSIDGSKKIEFSTTIGGHNLTNIQIGGTDPLGIISMGYAPPLVSVLTPGHNIPTGTENYEVVIYGASPSEYNGVFQALVAPGSDLIFLYSPVVPPPSSPANPPGFFYMPPFCLIFGPDAPTTYSGLLDAVAYGSIFFKFTFTTGGNNNTHVYTAGQDGAGYKAWNLLSYV